VSKCEKCGVCGLEYTQAEGEYPHRQGPHSFVRCRDAIQARVAALQDELEVAWSDCHDGKCHTCPKCYDALEAQLKTAREALAECKRLAFDMQEFYQHVPDGLRAMRDLERAIKRTVDAALGTHSGGGG
jgi:hypothetical protein